MVLGNFFKLLRAKQYLKNLFIFLPLFFAGKIANSQLLANTVLAFLIFSLISSSVYIFNDIFDLEEDRRHPVKKNRPLAAGFIKPQTAIKTAALLFLTGSVGAYLLNTYFFALILVYAAVNAAYTLKLKRAAIIDVVIIASGFVFRILAGGIVTGVTLSMWIVLLTFLLAMFLALAKRTDDFTANPDQYTKEFLASAINIIASVVIVSYIMYTCSAEVIARAHSDKLYLTTIFVIVGLLRYLQRMSGPGKNKCPTEALIDDSSLQLCILGWLGSLAIFIYF